MDRLIICSAHFYLDQLEIVRNVYNKLKVITINWNSRLPIWKEKMSDESQYADATIGLFSELGMCNHILQETRAMLQYLIYK